MCDGIANGWPRAIAAAPCPPSNVIIASNVLDTTGNVICGNIISQDGTFTGNLYIAGQVVSNITYSTLNVSGVSNAQIFSGGAYYGNGYGLSNLNANNLSGVISTLNLPASGVTAGSYGDFANVSSIRVDQYGRVTTASNVAIRSSQWTTIDSNVAYQNGVSIGTLSNPPSGSNLFVLGTANVTTLNVTTLFANSATIFGSNTLNVLGVSNLFYITGDAGGISNISPGAITGNVASANVALVVSQAAQPNITSLGTLSSLGVTGAVTAASFVGSGASLNNLQASNVSGTVATAGVVTNPAQINITSLGTLSSLGVTGAVTAASFAGSGAALSNLPSSNIAGTVATAGVVTNPAQTNITSLGSLSSLTVVGSLGAGTISGDGIGIYGIRGYNVVGAVQVANVVSQASQSNITSLGTLTELNVQGLLVASNGSGISNINASNVQSGTLSTAVFPASGVTAGIYGSGANVSSFTVDSLGRVTGASNIAITASQWTGAVGSPIYYENFVGIGSTATATSTLQVTGNFYASNAVTTNNLYFTNSIQATNLPPSGVSAGTYGTTSNIPSLVIDTYGRITGASNVALGVSSQWTSVNSNVAFGNGVSIGTLSNPPVGSNLYVLGLATISNISTGNATVLAANVGTLNVATISNLNTLTLTSNLSATNVFATTANASTLNVSSISVSGSTPTSGYVLSTTGTGLAWVVQSGGASSQWSNIDTGTQNLIYFVNKVGIGSSATPGANLTVTGNVYASNALSAPNVFVTTANVGTLNVATISNLNTLALTNNLYASNALTATNVFATTANVGTLNVATISNLNSLVLVNNLYASNALSAPNVFVTTANVGTLNVATISNLNTLTLVNNLYASNALTATNVFATTANVGTLNVWQVSNLANLTVSNTLTTTNIVAAGFTSNSTNTVFNFNTVTIPFVNSTTLNVTSTANLDTVTLTGEPGLPTLVAIGNAYVSNALAATNVFATTANVGTLNVFQISNLNTLALTNNLYASNALVATNLFSTTANVGTLNVTTISNLNTLVLTNNLYAPNSLATTNLFTTNANVGTLNVASVSNLANLVVSNSVTATNLFATKGLDVGPGTLGSNVVIFSNASGGANTFVMDSNGRVSIGAASGPGGSRLSFGQTIENKIITLYDVGNLDNPTSATSFYGFGMIGNAVRYQVPNSTTDRHSFFGGSSEYARITGTGISILTGAAPSANLHVAGNAYISNALQTTNVISSNINVTSTANIANLVVTSNILAGPSGNTYITGNVVVSGNVFSNLGTPLGSGGSLYFSLGGTLTPSTFTGVVYGQTLALSLATFSIQGTSTDVSRSANGYVQFSRTGVYNFRGVFCTTADNITGVAIGSNVIDYGTRTDQTYVYRHVPFISQNPTAVFDFDFYVGSTTNYYYIDLFAVDSPTLQATTNALGGTWLTIGPSTGGGGSGGSITISTLGNCILNTSPGAADYYVGVNNGSTITLPLGASLSAGKQYIIKDESGLAGTFVGYRVTLVASGSDLIDGQASLIIALNYGAINVIWTGTKWSIF